MRLRPLIQTVLVLLAGGPFAGSLTAQLPGLAGDKVSVSARFVPATAAPGSEVTLEVTATIAPGWHLYGSMQDPELGDPTRLVLEDTGVLAVRGPARIPPGDPHSVLGTTSHWVEGSLVAEQTLRVPEGAGVGRVEVSGKLTYMACTELMCDPPAALPFTAALEVGAAGKPVPVQDEEPALELPALEFPNSDLGLSKVFLDAVFTPAEARPGEIVTLEVTAFVEEGWHLYGSLQDPDLGDPTRLLVEEAAVLEPVGEAIIPPGEPHETFGEIGYWIEGDPVLRQQFRVPAELAAGSIPIRGQVSYMACNDVSCDPSATEGFRATLAVVEGEPREEYLTAMPAPAANASPPGSAATPSAAAAPQLPGPLAGGLWALILASVGAGLFALAMPCTYPMIPITFSFFTKQADVRGGKVLPLALAYGAGIVLMFVLIGMFVGPIIVAWATHWATNLVIGALFLLFAFVLFGMVNLQPPQFLTNMSGRAATQGGYVGVFLMGLTLVFATFTCTVPLVGALLSVTGRAGELGSVALGMAIFGLTMALPFVVLSLVPGKVKAMPRSGEWMHVLKVFLGFVELAAALKFFSNVDMVLEWKILPRELFLVIWAGIFFVAGIFLLGLFRLEGESRTSIGPGRMTTALAVIVFSFYCLFGSLGYQLDRVMTAIAPPYRAAVLTGGLTLGGGGEQLARGHTIISDEHDAAVARSIAEQKLTLINFTGHL